MAGSASGAISSVSARRSCARPWEPCRLQGRRRNVESKTIMAETSTIRSVITPNEQMLRGVFQLPKPYYIDIYQREYKWKRENIETLLKDIEVRFEQHERKKVAPQDIREDVQLHFDPYFLN